VALPIENKFADGNLFSHGVKQEGSDCWVMLATVVGPFILMLSL
jgi:hypothetical protein